MRLSRLTARSFNCSQGLVLNTEHFPSRPKKEEFGLVRPRDPFPGPENPKTGVTRRLFVRRCRPTAVAIVLRFCECLPAAHVENFELPRENGLSTTRDTSVQQSCSSQRSVPTLVCQWKGWWNRVTGLGIDRNRRNRPEVQSCSEDWTIQVDNLTGPKEEK